MREWNATGNDQVRVSVNISPKYFLDKKLPACIAEKIEEASISPSEIELEVNESVVQTSNENIAIFRELKKIGVQLSIDDFGIGYSSLASLNHVEVDRIKIDKYFVSGMLADSRTSSLVESMVEVGHKLGHEVVAEGIETSDQLEKLRSFGCNFGQGYLFSEPVPAATVLPNCWGRFLIPRGAAY